MERLQGAKSGMRNHRDARTRRNGGAAMLQPQERSTKQEVYSTPLHSACSS